MLLINIYLKIKSESVSHVPLFATLWTVDHKGPLSIGFSRQEFWSGQPIPFPEDLPDPRIKPGSPALQADSLPAEPQGSPRILEWVLCAQSCLTLATPQTVACQPPLFMHFSRQEYWSGQPIPSPGDLPDPGIEPGSPALQVDSLPTELSGKPKQHANRIRVIFKRA